MKLFLILISLLFFSCASRPDLPICPEATETVTLSKADAAKIHGKVSQFLTDAQITQQHDEVGGSFWRFTNMPSDSIYYQIGLREGDAILKTNLGPQSTSMNLLSDLAGIPSGTTNCLHVRSKENTDRIIKILVEKK